MSSWETLAWPGFSTMTPALLRHLWGHPTTCLRWVITFCLILRNIFFFKRTGLLILLNWNNLFIPALCVHAGTNKPFVLQWKIGYLVSGMFAVRTVCFIVSLISWGFYLQGCWFLNYVYFILAPHLQLTIKRNWPRRSERGSTEESLTDTPRSWTRCSVKC